MITSNYDIRIISNGLGRYLIYRGDRLFYKRAYANKEMAIKWTQKAITKITKYYL